jgi:hypothetical protein
MYFAFQMEDGTGLSSIILQIVINIVYFGSVFAFAYYWVPTKVTRTIDTLIISFKGASDRILKLEDIQEVRVLNTFSCSKKIRNSCFVFLNALPNVSFHECTSDRPVDIFECCSNILSYIFTTLTLIDFFLNKMIIAT